MKAGESIASQELQRFKTSEGSGSPALTNPAKIINANLSLGTFDLQTSKTHTERATNPNNVCHRLFIHLLFTFSPSLHSGNVEGTHNISCTCESKKLIKYLTVTCLERKAGRKPKFFFFSILTLVLPAHRFCFVSLTMQIAPPVYFNLFAFSTPLHPVLHSQITSILYSVQAVKW